MKFILIENNGEVEINSFALIGASTKRNSEGKIGFFGSGLKYSIAYMLRNNINFRIFSGENEIKFSTTEVSLRGDGFKQICINGVETSYTTTMGPTWTEDWFVLREIYCNALDESGVNLIKSTENVNPSSGKTRIYIELTNKLQSVINSWDSYFSEDKILLFETPEIYTSGIGTQDVGGSSHQIVKVYQKTEGILFRRGIRVGKSMPYMYDYELKFVNINEDRTASNISYMDYVFINMLAQFVNEEWIKYVLNSCKNEVSSQEYRTLNKDRHDGMPSRKWVNFSNSNTLVLKEQSGRYSERINNCTQDVYFIPSFFAKKLKQQLPDVKILGLSNIEGDISFEFCDKSEKIKFLLKETLQKLTELNYRLLYYPIEIVNFYQDNINGYADIKNKRILLSESLFDKGIRNIALVIMEECEHLDTKFEDETREFQNHIFSQWLKQMENSNGLFL